MLDDTRELLLGETQDQTQNASRYMLRENVANILDQRITRVHTSSWADSLRFLTFDDGSDDETKETDPEAPLVGQCQPCQDRLPIPSGHFCEMHGPRSNKAGVENREAELRQYANPCVHVREHSCKTCQHIPLFPNEKVTKFRIRRVNKPGSAGSNCDHFVAVSYCWSSATPDSGDEEAYKVVEEDGSIRDMRAAKSTIDRVVAFARENGFRVIWIDQECIEQDNPQEQELAIQAMDNVYLRAHTSIGLFNVELQQQDLLCILKAYQYHSNSCSRIRGGRAPPHIVSPPTQNALFDALSQVVNDRWNTRAWILQEAFASSGNMMLLFPRCADVDVEGWMLICHEWSRSEMAIRLDAMQNCFRIIKPKIGHRLREEERDVSRPVPPIPMEQNTASKTDRSVTLKRMACFHPGEPEPATKFSVGASKPRRTCNAAVALAYLKIRGLLRVPDKLAIIANMCNYHVRFNTVELEKTQKSLSACVLALSVINGDFSLLVSQFYRQPSASPPISFSENEGDFSWVHSLTHQAPLLQANEWNPYGSLSLENVGSTVNLSEHGLSLLGHLWKKDRFVSLESLQVKHAHGWKQLHTSKGHSKPDKETVRLATTHLLFKIIESLASQGEKELANSILNSTSNAHWHRHSDVDDMVESVDEFPPGLRVENRAGMFALDSSGKRRYHQSWIIDRVMEEGGLWSWSLVNNMPESAESSDADEELVKHFASRGHSRMMRIGAMMSMVGELGTRQAGTTESLMKHSAAGAIFALYHSKAATQGPELSRRRATFDVDENLRDFMVLTPFQMVLESLPRPSIRSMGVSWVVEEAGSRVDVPEGDGEEKCFQVRGMVRGMWRFILLSTGRYTLV